MNISNHKNTILIIIIVLLAFFGYWFFFLSKKEATKTTSSRSGSLTTTQAPAATAGNTQYDKEFVTSLLGLNSVNLDVSIFQSKVYQALSYPEVPFVVNYSRESGRDNPFLPIGVDPIKAQNAQTQVNVNPTAAPVTPTPTPTPAPTNPVKTTAPTTPTAPITTPAPKPKQF